MAHRRTLDADYHRELEQWLPEQGTNCWRSWMSAYYEDLTAVWARDQSHEYPPHIHNCVEVTWVYKGQGTITCRGVDYAFQAGDVFIIAPNELHAVRSGNGEHCTFAVLHLPSQFYWPLIHDYARKGCPSALEPVRVLDGNRLDIPEIEIFQTIVQADGTRKMTNTLTTLLEHTLTIPQRFSSQRPEKTFWHPAVVHARDALASNLAEPVNISDIAAAVGLNVRYFIALFKEGTGLSPHQYQIALRVERARHLIQSSDTPLSEIALCAGFADQSHLNRHFKRGYGFTPGGFKQILNPI